MGHNIHMHACENELWGHWISGYVKFHRRSSVFPCYKRSYGANLFKTSFVSASAELKTWSNNDPISVERYLEKNNCYWLFIPTHACHIGEEDSSHKNVRLNVSSTGELKSLMVEVVAIINVI